MREGGEKGGGGGGRRRKGRRGRGRERRREEDYSAPSHRQQLKRDSNSLSPRQPLLVALQHLTAFLVHPS